jgi:hypothetical protein
MLDDNQMRLPVLRLLIPLYGLKTTRYRRDHAVTPALGEKDLHLHDDSVVKVQTLPSVPEYCYPFRMNESHTSR